MDNIRRDVENLFNDTKHMIEIHDHKINEIVNRIDKTSKNIWTEQLVAQMIGAFFIILGFGAITWRAVSILETKFEFMERNIETNTQEILRVRNKLEKYTE